MPPLSVQDDTQDDAALAREIREHIGHQWSNYEFVQSEKVREIMTRAADALERRVLTPPSPAGDGWVMVPVEPTEDQVRLGIAEIIHQCYQSGEIAKVEGMKKLYAAILSARPTASSDGERNVTSPQDLRDRVAGALVCACAKFYGDRVPETFDMTLSNILADAAIEVITSTQPDSAEKP